MKWSERFATGIPELDNQHQLLFRMAHDYGETLASGRGERTYDLMLKGLTDYAKAHFGFEEQCMFRHQCPAATANSAAHAEFLEMLTHYRQRYTDVGFDRNDAERLIAFLDTWLTNHIGRIDVQLRSCITDAV